jgi:hypothetical protein
MRYPPISQFAEERVGIMVTDAGQLIDPDGNTVLVSLARLEPDPANIFVDEVATRDDEGLSSYLLSSVDTSEKGVYETTWEYTVGGAGPQNERIFRDHHEVVDPMVFWDSLVPDERGMVANVHFFVSDLFDSRGPTGTRTDGGGPYLWELPQASFGYETAARLAVTEALDYINFTYPPELNFVTEGAASAGGGRAMPRNAWGLWQKATAWALYKHLGRSYLEIPDVVNSQITRLDRQRYHDKWMAFADKEKEELGHMLRILKRRYLLGGKSRSLLVSGGMFPLRFLNPARPRWPYAAVRF